LPEIEATGTQMIAISPMLQKYSKQLVEKLDLDFPLLCDPGNQVADQFGLVFDLDPKLREVYLTFGIDLERFNGDDSWQMALPGRVIVDREGIIRNSDFHPDHTTRPEPEETLAKLKAL
jgi:peroxiredoxin